MAAVWHKSKVFLVLLFAFLAGVAFATFWPGEFFYWYCFALAFLVLLAFFWSNWRLRLGLLIPLFFVFGAGRYALALPAASEADSLIFYHGQDKHLLGVVSAQPEPAAFGQRLVVEARGELKGKLTFVAGQGQVLSYGDLIEFNCQLAKPGGSREFAYDKYLARFNIYSVCDRATDLVKIKEGQGNPILAWIIKFKQSFVRQANDYLPEPHSSLFLGIMIGLRSTLAPGLVDNLNKVGLTHIVAVSGSNITIVAGILLFGLRFFGLPRRLNFWLVVGSIIFYVFLTGASASVVRAGIMGILAILAFNLSRPSRIANAIVFAAFVMVLVNPKILLFDLGFQLSFLALLGLVFLQPILAARLKFIPDFLALRAIFSATLAASITTAPLLLFQFGRLSLISPLANILVLPIIPVLMIFGFVAAAIASIGLGQFFYYPLWLTLEYIIRAVELLGSFSFASWDGGKISPVLLLAVYAVIFFFVFIGRKKKNEYPTA